MTARFLGLTLAAAILIHTGCAAGFRAGGSRAGVGAGAAIGSPPPPVVTPVPDVRYTPPLPQ